jgi:hypothetical protein
VQQLGLGWLGLRAAEGLRRRSIAIEAQRTKHRALAATEFVPDLAWPHAGPRSSGEAPFLAEKQREK